MGNDIYYEQFQSNPQKPPPFRAYRMNGAVTIHEHDEISARMDEEMRTGHPMVFKARREQLAAVWFAVEEMYDQTPGIDSATKRIG